MNAKRKKYHVTDFVFVMIVDIVFHFVKKILIALAVKNVSKADVDPYVLSETGVQKDKYAYKVSVYRDVITIEIVVMICYVP